jgi:hypothetical protein
VRERLKRGVPGHESTAVKWRELADRHAVTSDHEALARIECAHDLAALVAKLPLR